MKYCPSPTCAYAVKYHRTLEYLNDILVCTECGSALSEQPPEVSVVDANAPEMPREATGHDVMGRLAVTITAALLIAVGLKTPLFGFQSSVMGGGFQGLFNEGAGAEFPRRLSLLGFGIEPFVDGFLLVELVALIIPALRQRRVGSAADRAALNKAALMLGVLLLGGQIAGVVQFLGSMEPNFTSFPSPGAVWAQYLLAHLGLIALLFWVTRRGLLNGFALVALVEAASATISFLGKLRAMLLEGNIVVGRLMLMVVLLAGVALVVIWLSRWSRPSGELGPTAVPFPVSGLAPWLLTTSLIVLFGTMASILPPFRQLQELIALSPEWIHSGVSSFLTLDGTLLFGLLFFRPRAVGSLWARWVKGADEMGAVVRARALLPRALLLSVAVLVIAPLGTTLLGMSEPSAVGGGVIAEVFIGALVVLDLVEEWRARRKYGSLVSILHLHRMAEVEPVSYVLQRAGIPIFTRSVSYRAALQFFGPYIPVEILVPRDRADEARRVLDGV